MADKYAYAVARIRTLENDLLTDSDIGQLLACQTCDSALEFLAQKGWGGGTDWKRKDDGREEEERAGGTEDAWKNREEQMLRRETEKIWETAADLHVDPSVFEILAFRPLYHNLKAAVREVCTGKAGGEIYYAGRVVEIAGGLPKGGSGSGISSGISSGNPGQAIYTIVREKNFSALPWHMRDAAAEALEAMLQTGDGQLCDTIVDRARVHAVEQEGNDSPVEVLRLWSAEFVAAADIRIAVRAARAGKNRTFLERALAPCRRLNVSGLCAAALSGAEAVYSFLGAEGYGEAAEALKESDTAFERWCDNRVIRTIRPQKYRAFSAGPLAAYVLARENEIKTVRMILTGKQNGLPDQAIRERVREMYV